MGQPRDNWGRLVEKVVQREEDRQKVYMNSSTSSSSTSSSFTISVVNESPRPTFFSRSTEDHHQIFFLDKKTRQKCVIVGARDLTIVKGDRPEHWQWTSHVDSRFSEVARLKLVYRLDIRCKIDTGILPEITIYGAYLVFKLENGKYGLDLVGGVVRYVNRETESHAAERAALLHLHRGYPLDKIGRLATKRDDGWLEIELGDFHNNQGDNGEVEARLMEIKRLHEKFGLIVEGIEFRPKTSFDQIVLLNGGKLNFFLDNGTKCFIVGARKLMISWAENPEHWEWTSHEESRFPDGAQLKTVYWLDIRCNIRTQLLVRNTRYVAYLVFKLAKVVRGLESVRGVVRFVNKESLVEAAKRASLLHLHQVNGVLSPHQAGRLGVNRGNGWMEIELGEFDVEHGDAGEVEARVMETSDFVRSVVLLLKALSFDPGHMPSYKEVGERESTRVSSQTISQMVC